MTAEGNRPAPGRWRRPEELVEVGFERSRVVMMNEAHSGLRRSIRTREVGRAVLPAANRAGVRHLAMEALTPAIAARANATRRVLDAASGYLSQPEMRRLVQAALDRDWSLIAYEADPADQPPGLEPLTPEGINWREEEQARRLARALEALPSGTKLLVWCGNGHLSKAEGRSAGPVKIEGAPVGQQDVTLPAHRFVPMGARFEQIAGLQPFAIDQAVTVEFDTSRRNPWTEWAQHFAPVLESHGGTAGFLFEEAPADWPPRKGVDAVLLSLDNALS
jgi:hypothetical protein